ncbi:hypothetical protein J6590_062514 [Homalodisca vitripennis]|nr:hypothetical protein J6590_062514 [Homalodisca vitripennis]
MGQEEEQSDTPTLNSVGKPPQTIRRRSNPPEQQIKDAFCSLNEALHRKIDDAECYLYGELLAKKNSESFLKMTGH